MLENKLDFEADENIRSTQLEILELDGIYQGVMAGQGCGHIGRRRHRGTR